MLLQVLRAVSPRVGAATSSSSSAPLAGLRSRTTAANELLLARHISSSASLQKKQEEGEEVRGPLRKMLDLFDHLKTQVTEDNPIYEKSKPYQKPKDIKRASIEKGRNIETNAEATDVTLHKDSRWEAEWKNFTENSSVASGISEMQQRFDESDNLLVRTARGVTDSLQERIGSLLQDDDDSKAVLREVQRLDPTFDKVKFELHLERTVIPAVLEGYYKGDAESLKEWCTEGCFEQIKALIDLRNQDGRTYQSDLLDVSDLEFLMAKQMHEDLVMIFSVQTQQTKMVTDRDGTIVEGGPDYIEHSFYTFAMRRDTNVFDPDLAWRVLEISEAMTRPII